MKASAIYRTASEIMEGGEAEYFFGCALDKAGQPNPGGDDSPLQKQFLALFPEIESYWGFDRGATVPVQQLALLFMSAIAKDSE